MKQTSFEIGVLPIGYKSPRCYWINPGLLVPCLSPNYENFENT